MSKIKTIFIFNHVNLNNYSLFLNYYQKKKYCITTVLPGSRKYLCHFKTICFIDKLFSEYFIYLLRVYYAIL